MENYTPIIRKKCVCKYCKADTCSKCIERYLLDRHEDAHCLHCRVNYNDTTLNEICTRTYLQNVYFKHRQEVLINRERANLPGLQEEAARKKRWREKEQTIKEMSIEAAALLAERDKVLLEYNKMYIEYAKLIVSDLEASRKLRVELDKITKKSDDLRDKIQIKREDIVRIRWGAITAGGGTIQEAVQKQEEEKRKFIRRCTRDGCQGFLSTAWKCGICEYYSCSKCFVTKTQKHDDPHECKKEDVETAEMIKKDSKPCPNCGEFIMKSSGCQQMWCISCQTPWDWGTGKVVTTGAIHNPHYYEWMRRNGQGLDRNPLDVPCGGYPNAWELRRMPRGLSSAVSSRYFEFHRICQELQDISGRNYRSHIDQATTTEINVKFLLGDYDEKHWGQLLGKNERKRKRDREVQEVLAAFRMVAVELINRVQNYRSEDGLIRSFTDLPPPEAEKFLAALYVEIDELIKMINDGLRNVSIGFRYTVPYLAIDGAYYSIKTKNFSDEVKKKRGAKKGEDEEDEESVVDDDRSVVATTRSVLKAGGVKEENVVVEPTKKKKGKPKVAVAEPVAAPEPAPAAVEEPVKEVATATEAVAKMTIRRKKPQVATVATTATAVATAIRALIAEHDEDAELQEAIEASLQK